MACSCRTTPLRLFLQSFAHGRQTLPVASISQARGIRPLFQRDGRRYASSSSSSAAASGAGVGTPKAETSQIPDEGAKTAPSQSQHDPFLQESKQHLYSMMDKLANMGWQSMKGQATRDASSPPSPNPSRPTYKSKSHSASSQPNPEPREHEPWRIQKDALKTKFPEGWKPRKRLSPDAIAGIRALHSQYPDEYTTPRLAQQFQVSPEAIRRILKSRWRATAEEEQRRQERWFRRGVSVWSRYAEMGTKPPRRWRQEGVGVVDGMEGEGEVEGERGTARGKGGVSSFYERGAIAFKREQQERTEEAGARLMRKMGRLI